MTLRAVVRKAGPLIDVSQDGQVPLHPRVYKTLEGPLSYTHLKLVYGAAAYDNDTGDRQTVIHTPRRLYQYDDQGRFACQKGFYPKIRTILQGQGFEVIFIDKDPPQNERKRTAQWDRLFERFQLRAQQDICLAQIDMHEYGVVDAPPAFGKTHLMAMICVLYPYAKIDIVTKRKDIVESIRNLLTRWIPDVGQVGGGKKKHRRVTVYTADSLHHSNYDADILLVDEGHELMTDRLAELLSRYWYSRNYTFTATPDMRLDNAHFRMEGLFGPRIFKMTQQQAEEAGLVAHVMVQWVEVNPGFNPVMPYKTLVSQKRHGIWRNQSRNQQIAATAQAFLQDGKQVLILVDTVDHALHIRKLLPTAELCYSEGALMDAAKRERYIRDGFLDEDEFMTTPLRNSLRRRFESRELMLAIATGVWAVGVSFDSLNVLIRADAGDSETANVQLPGRVCRNDPATGKDCGILVDFMDVWDSKFKARSMNRRRDYFKRGWTQLRSDGTVWRPRGAANTIMQGRSNSAATS